MGINNKELNERLGGFSDVFTEPEGLPLARIQFHNIHLDLSTPHVSVRLYRQAQFQKDEVERIVQEMLQK